MIARRVLGRTGLSVSELGLGTWALGGLGKHADAKNYGPVEERDAQEVFEAYLAAGGNHFDCAENYHDGEQRLGKFIARHKDRDDLVICSKVWQTDETTIRRKLEQSRKNLNRDIIDVHYLHNPPEDRDEMHRTLDLFCQLKEEGKIRAIGATIKGHNVTDETIALIEQYVSTGKLDVVMCIFSVLRQKTSETFEFAETAGVGVVLRTVLESGFLTGKYQSSDAFASHHDQDHRRRWEKQKLSQILTMVEDFRSIAKAGEYQSCLLAALRFALDTSHVSSVLVGAKNVRQLSDNLAVLQLPPMDHQLRETLIDRFSGKEAIVSLGF